MDEFFYHILNRGVEKRKIFLDKKDYLRFVHNLSDFNNLNYAFSYYNRRNSAMRKPNLQRQRKRQREEIVDVLCWTLMPNHHHILLRGKTEGGGSLFSKKLTSGYTQYFNRKNERVGVLFQGRSKIILVERDTHFLHLPFYILTNPLDLFQSDWRERGVKNSKKAFEFLENYQWSALLDLIGKENFPEVINKNLFFELFDTNEKRFKKDFVEWLESYDGEVDFEDFDEKFIHNSAMR